MQGHGPGADDDPRAARHGADQPEAGRPACTVSRPHLVKLLDDGTIDHYKVGTHRRVRIENVLDYRDRRASVRRKKLDELTRLSEELEGGYQ